MKVKIIKVFLKFKWVLSVNYVSNKTTDNFPLNKKLMLSKSLIKLVNSLSVKKYRQKHNLFVAEGHKLVSDILQMNAEVKYIITANSDFNCKKAEVIYASQNEFKKLSNFKTPSEIIAVVKIPQQNMCINNIANELSLALDDIQDPGNMGTIIRIANWFGIKNIICSKSCTDIYNPKVVQSSMGAIMGVKVHYVNLHDTIKDIKENAACKVYGTFMSGNNIYKEQLSSKGIIVMGNEGKGISEDIQRLIDCKLSIPDFANSSESSESLNVSVSTGIVVSEFRRRGMW